MISGYDHFVQLAETLQWDETDIDFSADGAGGPKLDETEQAKVLGLLAGFVIAETAVAGNLGNYQVAATARDEKSMAAAFQSQARDEARHAPVLRPGRHDRRRHPG